MGTLRDVNIRDIDHQSQYVFLINVTSPSDVRTPPVQRFQITLVRSPQFELYAFRIEIIKRNLGILSEKMMIFCGWN